MTSPARHPAPREAARRIAVWTMVAIYFGLVIPTIILRGEWWVLVGWTGFPVVGAVILTARPAHAIGRLLIGIGLYWAFFGLFGYADVYRALPVWWEIADRWVGYLVWLALPLILVLFPSGRIETRLGRVIGRGMLALGAVLLVLEVVDPTPMEETGRANPLGLPALAPVTEILLGDATFAIVPITVGLALIDLIRRWRRSTGAQRLQFSWLAFGAAITISCVAIVGFADGVARDLSYLFILGLSAIPVAIGIAVTRHGLYEIGRVVSRTVSYTIVTAFAIGVYALIVASATLLLPGAPAIGVALATLSAAAVFLPALRWVRHRVDRRFDRERYDAARVVAAFGGRLRSSIDPESTSEELTRTVEQALQPASVGLWTAGGAQAATPDAERDDPRRADDSRVGAVTRG